MAIFIMESMKDGTALLMRLMFLRSTPQLFSYLMEGNTESLLNQVVLLNGQVKKTTCSS